MAHAYYLKYPKEAQTILETLLSNDPIKAYDHHLSDNQYIKNYYYPPIFVQSRHRSSIDRKTNQNHLRSIDYGINYSSHLNHEDFDICKCSPFLWTSHLLPHLHLPHLHLHLHPHPHHLHPHLHPPHLHPHLPHHHLRYHEHFQ